MTFIYNLKGDRPMRKLAMIMFVAGLVPAAASAQTQKVWKNGPASSSWRAAVASPRSKA
jgi:hypothetical protein